MNIQQRIFNFIAQFFFERPARKRSMDEHIAQLEESGQEIATEIADTTDTPKNRQQLTHLIGIERWGQRRLQILLGEPPIDDEYDGYQPPADIDWSALRQAFTETRGETVAIAKDLRQREVPVTSTVLHNGFGPLTVRGWLQYLNSHAKLEARRIR